MLDLVERYGSIRFDEFVEVALYHPDGGFFTVGGGAGRSGADFITSPEVGPLYGAVVAAYLDARWDELGRPDPYVVVDAGAGRGALAISLLAAEPRCAPALRLILVERSEELRARQADHLELVHPFEVLGPSTDDDRDGLGPRTEGRGPLCCALPDLPAARFAGVVVANELLDNLPFRLFERGGDGWREVRVSEDASGGLAELLVPADDAAAARLDELVPEAAAGARVPLQAAAVDWLTDALALIEAGSVLVVDYAATTAQLAARPVREWLRTYRGHERGGDPLDAPGSQDITCEVALDQLARVAEPDDTCTQAEWLRRWGIDDLVEEGRRLWAERAHAPDLAAIRARSRAVEAEALLDPSGLGAFTVAEWRR